MDIYKPGRLLLNNKLKSLKGYASGKILDVCSGGKDYRWIFNVYEEYKTLEIDSKFKPDIIGSAYEIPLADNSLNTIICTQVLEHLERPSKALSEFYRVLKQDGIGIISVPFFNELHDEPYDFFDLPISY
jgi:predicted SAM-dependent methyltransferase